MKVVNLDWIIVVFDNVVKDKLCKNMIVQVVLFGVLVNMVLIKKMVEVVKDVCFGKIKVMFLFEMLEDVLKVIESGVDIKEFNVGLMVYFNGKVNVN